MKIAEIFLRKPTTVSFEIFPPKPDAPFAPVLDAINRLSALRPDFISVTYGAAGVHRGCTMEIAEHIAACGIAALVHLTCIASSPKETDDILEALKERHLRNVLALRGDPPVGDPPFGYPMLAGKIFAKDLVERIKSSGGFCVAAAAYPEGHPECPNRALELFYLKEKIAAGVDFLITQIFFDNAFFYGFLEELDRAAVALPVSAGIMPVFSQKQVERICALCGASIPKKLRLLMDKYGHSQDEMQKAGLEYASLQIEDLLEHNVRGVHLYTMNRPELAEFLVANTKLRQAL
ncbi:MAG: methylenetetrahydrofolate reductase [Acidaminococcales bacterium]|jgi:methylenetetrahydrofolate reductase (NADPH)|nr:methylenetetrahydrofolate reductase [Acidaminococcales bacterium]